MRLLFTDKTLSPWNAEDLARAAAGLVNRELDSPFIDPDTIKMRLTCPRDTEICRDTYLTKSQIAAINALRARRDKRFGRKRHTDTIMEMPDEIRGGEAIPAAIAETLRQLEDGRSLEDMRKQGILDIGEWRAEVPY